MSDPKYKVGDIVRMVPSGMYSDSFIEQCSASGEYLDAVSRNPQKIASVMKWPTPHSRYGYRLESTGGYGWAECLIEGAWYDPESRKNKLLKLLEGVNE